MKRKMILILVTLLILNISLTGVLAEVKTEVAGNESGKEAALGQNSLFSKDGLEKAIKLVKSKIDIPENYDQFSSDVSNYGNNTMCRLRWYTDYNYTGKNGGSLEVMVDEHGSITSYSHYKYNTNYDYQRRVPKVGKAQALDTARKFFCYMSPELIGQIAFSDGSENCTIEYDGSYRFTFYREYKGIPLYENTVSVLVNGQTGEVSSYSLNWTDGLIFPGTGNIITKEEAVTAFKNKIGLQLKYRRTYGEDSERTYLEYSPAAEEMYSTIDAITGEKADGNRNNIPYSDINYKYDMYRREASMETPLSAKQADELKEIEGLVSVQSAEKQVKNMTELGLDDSYTLENYSYSKYGNGVNYSLRLDFNRVMTKEDIGRDIPDEKIKLMMAAGEYGRRVNILLDARTSEMISFSSYGASAGGDGSMNYSRADMQKTAEDFLSKYKASKYSQIKLSSDPQASKSYIYKYGMAGPDSLVYNRAVNGIPFEDNQITINIDPVSGKISSYNEVWDNLEFVSTDNVIGIDRAYEILFNTTNFELKYTLEQVQKDMKPDPYQKTDTSSNSVKLVYALDAKKPVCIDANKGILIERYNAIPYREAGKMQYSDIAVHPVRDKILALAEIGLLFDEESFRPDEPIAQKDLLYIIAKIKGNGIISSQTAPLNQRDLDGMYRALINDGTIDEEERNPDQGVTREDAVKYLLKSAGYAKLAELDAGLFNCSFGDKGEINTALIGYVAIAKVLGIIDGSNGNFMPKQLMTRADAAVMAYNYLKR